MSALTKPVPEITSSTHGAGKIKPRTRAPLVKRTPPLANRAQTVAGIIPRDRGRTRLPSSGRRRRFVVLVALAGKTPVIERRYFDKCEPSRLSRSYAFPGLEKIDSYFAPVRCVIAYTAYVDRECITVRA